MATLNSIDLGDIQTEAQAKDSGLFNTPVPRSDSTNSLLTDIFGTGKTITLNGTYVGTVSQIRTFITAIETIQNGEQTVNTYSGGLMSDTKNVLVSTFNWDYVKADVNSLGYTLTLIEGTVI